MSEQVSTKLTRQDIQSEAIVAWVKSKWGTLIIPTGVGKSFIGVTIACGQIKKGIISSCLIVVPTVNLIEQWKKEIIKWGYPLDGITIKCIQTAYKEVSEYDLLVLDEIHTTLGPKYSKIYENATVKQRLGLTATAPKDLILLNEVCPIVYSRSVKEAIEAEAFNEYSMYNVEVPFNRKEQATYNTFDRQFKLAKLQLVLLKRDLPELKDLTVFDIAKLYNSSKEKSELVKYSKMFWSSMSLRKMVCYKAWSKAEVAITIIKRNLSKKWIVFTKSIEMAEEMTECLYGKAVVYHSKQKDTDRVDILKKYEENKFNILIAVDALNAGLNIPEIDAAICVSGNSSEIDAVQRLGRIARKKEKKSLYINLYSKDTVEKKWLETRNKGLESRWVTINKLYDEI